MSVGGGADVMEQDELSSDSLLPYLERCVQEPGFLEQKRSALAEAGAGDAVELLCELVEEVVD
jgi:UDP-N-acetylglucosamine:LPS N-acetylglucosamine transferase